MRFVHLKSYLARRLFKPFHPINVLAIGMALATPISVAHAGLTLTQAGIFRGLSISTFAVDFPLTNNIGPVGIDVQTDNTVLVTTAGGNIQRFANVDNQSAASVPVLINYPGFANAHAIAHLGSSIYLSQGPNAQVLELNPDGSTKRVVAQNLSFCRAIVPSSATGHLFVASVTGIKDIDPLTGNSTTFADVVADGLAISSDGLILYAVVVDGPKINHIVGWNTVTASIIFDSGVVPGSIDGIALGANALTGNIYANSNTGTVIEVNLNTLIQTTIATGGSRGDFVSVDHADGSLLLSQTDSILRLHGSFIPGPGVVTLLGIGMLWGCRRRRSE